jgi:hypothetical protein
VEATVPIYAGEVTRHALLSYRELADGQCEVTVTTEGKQFAGVADDFFEALLRVRAQLEPNGLLLGVRGASLDVWPSSMARQMGGGLKAYRMVMGKQALSRDLVSIFEVSPDIRPATVIDQMANRDAWFKSLGNEGGESRASAV